MKSSSGRLLQRNGRVALADRRGRQAEYARGGRRPRWWLIPPPVGGRRFVVHFQRQLISARSVGEKKNNRTVITVCRIASRNIIILWYFLSLYYYKPSMFEIF